MSTHAIYGPSTLQYRDLCPGWTSDRDSDPTWANEGTLMHKAYETGDLSILENDEQKGCVQMALDYTSVFEAGALEVHKELRLEILGGLTFGTADRVILVKSPGGQLHAHMLDLKNGRNEVEDAESNLQGIAYAVGVFEKWAVATVTVHFLLPRRDEVTTHRFTRADYPKLAQRIKGVITRCQIYARTRDESLLNPSEKACLYCGNRGCPALRGTIVALAKKYEPLEVVDEVHSSQITVPEQMAKAVILARVLEKWCASVKKHALAMVLEQGLEIPGYEVRERAGSTEINNPVLAYNVLMAAGLDPVEIVSAAKLSKTKLEELVAAKAPHRKGAQKVRELNAALASAECISSGEPQRFLQKIRS